MFPYEYFLEVYIVSARNKWIARSKPYPELAKLNVYVDFKSTVDDLEFLLIRVHSAILPPFQAIRHFFVFLNI